jgi:hypothetical protein
MIRRRRALLLLVVALILVVVIASGLPGLKLKNGTPFEIRSAAQQTGGYPGLGEGDLWIKFVRGIITLGIILFPVYIIYMLIDRQRRKRLLAELAGYALLVAAMLLVQNYLRSKQLLAETPLSPEQIAPSPPPLANVTPVSFNGQPSEAAVSLVAVILGILVAAGGGLLAWLFFFRLKPRPEILEKVADEAEETIEALLAGKNLRETILLCYRRMTEVVVKQRGIPRDASVTPHEFEQILLTQGLPSVAVRDLTHLFEDVRYGDIEANEEGRRRATLALRTIISACRKKEMETA